MNTRSATGAEIRRTIEYVRGFPGIPASGYLLAFPAIVVLAATTPGHRSEATIETSSPTDGAVCFRPGEAAEVGTGTSGMTSDRPTGSTPAKGPIRTITETGWTLLHNVIGKNPGKLRHIGLPSQTDRSIRNAPFFP